MASGPFSLENACVDQEKIYARLQKAVTITAALIVRIPADLAGFLRAFGVKKV